ncbi:DMT family transporter [Arcanobacterium canis]|uniref:SMR family transporter n=1 Tax=Arcanobacterium canis TaxID=999183 RepID=A0ABY8G069_9ACTO|nr:SMR family transporter [Arcanobacterium canis]WFM84171.1 SMR family transporter [Arcanobacterium canis]
MAWFILLCAGVMEAVWAIALAKSDGFTKRTSTVVFVLACILSLAGLAMAMTQIPTGTAYAVWTAIGASLTVVYAMVTGEERASYVKIVVLVVLVVCVIGLKAVA